MHAYSCCPMHGRHQAYACTQACLRALGFSACKKKDVLAALQPHGMDQESAIDFDTFEQILRKHYQARSFPDLGGARLADI